MDVHRTLQRSFFWWWRGRCRRTGRACPGSSAAYTASTTASMKRRERWFTEHVQPVADRLRVELSEHSTFFELQATGIITATYSEVK